MAESGDIRISGSGTISGGSYNNISVSGGGKWLGDIDCFSFHVSGGAKGEGDIRAQNEVSVSGSLKSGGSVLCEGTVRISGSAMCSGKLTGAEVRISGGASCDALSGKDVKVSGSLKSGSVRAEQLKISGGCAITGDCEGETVEISGSSDIGGLLNADEVLIHVSRTTSSNIGSIGGRSITVDCHVSDINLLMGAFIFGNRPVPSCRLVTESIEADEVNIMSTKASVVRGNNVSIGEGCEIHRVEYSGSLEIHPSSTVDETVQI